MPPQTCFGPKRTYEHRPPEALSCVTSPAWDEKIVTRDADTNAIQYMTDIYTFLDANLAVLITREHKPAGV